METDSTRFLKKIIATIFPTVIWLLFIVTMGIYNAWFFFGEYPTTGNYIFYGLALASLLLLIRHLYRLWKTG